jgi:hypothetical protein
MPRQYQLPSLLEVGRDNQNVAALTLRQVVGVGAEGGDVNRESSHRPRLAAAPANNQPSFVNAALGGNRAARELAE